MTIKTQEGKVITKDGKPSCSCCGCGVYSGFHWYDGFLDFEDFPDEIRPSSGEYTQILPKTLINSGPFGKGDILYKISVPGVGTFSVQSFDNRSATPNEDVVSWTFFIEDTIIGYLSSLSSLIETTNTSGLFEDYTDNASIETLFANSYSITGPVSGVVMRNNRPVVVFEGPIGNGIVTNTDFCMEYFGPGLRLIFNASTYKWTVNGNAKIGFQNTPVGSYAGGFTVS